MRIEDHLQTNYVGNPLVSVVTVVLNGELLLTETIESVINQTYPSIEYIIIDGGSSDNTVNIIKKYEDNIDRWISESDSGIYDAMNKGAQLARGEWIIFMNAGDRFFEHDTIKKVFNNYPMNAELIYGDCQVKYDSFIGVRRAGDLKDFWKGMVFSHQSLFTKRKLLCENNYAIQHALYAEFEFLWKMILKGHIFYYSRNIISTVGSMGLSDKNRIKVLKGFFSITKENKNGFAVYLYFACRIVLEMAKVFLKRILPRKTVSALQRRKLT